MNGEQGKEAVVAKQKLTRTAAVEGDVINSNDSIGRDSSRCQKEQLHLELFLEENSGLVPLLALITSLGPQYLNQKKKKISVIDTRSTD